MFFDVFLLLAPRGHLQPNESDLKGLHTNKQTHESNIASYQDSEDEEEGGVSGEQQREEGRDANLNSPPRTSQVNWN